MTDEQPEPVIPTPTEPATMSPSTRFVRTLLQVVVAVAAAVPGAAALFDLSAATSAKITAFAGACVVLASAAHNAFNQTQARRH